jgi:hypothetical protein
MVHAVRTTLLLNRFKVTNELDYYGTVKLCLLLSSTKIYTFLR